MLIRLLESRSAILHALIELISLDEVVKPNYWKKTLWRGFMVSISCRARAFGRGEARTSRYFSAKPELKVLLPQTTRSTRRTP